MGEGEDEPLPIGRPEGVEGVATGTGEPSCRLRWVGEGRWPPSWFAFGARTSGTEGGIGLAIGTEAEDARQERAASGIPMGTMEGVGPAADANMKNVGLERAPGGVRSDLGASRGCSARFFLFLILFK